MPFVELSKRANAISEFSERGGCLSLRCLPPKSITMMRRSLILAAAFVVAPTVWADGEDEEDAGYVSSTVRPAAGASPSPCSSSAGFRRPRV